MKGDDGVKKVDNNNTVKTEVDQKVKRCVSLLLMGTIITASVFSVSAFGRKVNVNVEGETISTITIDTDTDRILSRVGLSLNDNDSVCRKDEDDGSINIDVKKAFSVYVCYMGETKKIKIAEGTVEDALKMLNIDLGTDEISDLPLNEALVPDMKINVSKLVGIKLLIGGECQDCTVPSGTVSDALKFLNIDFSTEDIINVDICESVYDGMEISINRVEYREETVTEDIPFETVYNKSDSMNKGDSKVETSGQKGERRVTYKKKFVDGVEVESEELTSEILSNPVNEVVVKGTKNVQKATQNNNSSDGKVLHGTATAYTASQGARTSTGATPKQGVTVAVNPNVIPYGSRLEVTSEDGSFKFICKAQDTGGAMRSGRRLIDVYFNNRSDCIKFGCKKVSVKILK